MAPATQPPTRALFTLPYEEYYPDELTGRAGHWPAASGLLGQEGFAGYPADFSDGTVAWDLDLIDAEPGKLSYDGDGIYIAVLDTGLVPNWRDYFPEERIAAEYGIGFYESVLYKNGEYIYGGEVHQGSFLGKLAHGTHVTSTIIGYSYYGQYIRGVAPKAKIIPVKVLDCYENLGGDTFGTDLMVAAGINYIADLAESEEIEIVISMSIGGPEPGDVIEEAIDYAISKGVIVVAAAGNRGRPMGWPASPTGAPTWDWIMDWPGAYPQVISVGSCGWGMGTTITPGMGEWEPYPQPRPRTWWYKDVPEDMEHYLTYISYFSSRECVNPDFPTYTVELDVVAPGSWVLGPYPGDTFGYQHIPWWAQGSPWNPNTPPPNYWYVGGTSMATPHVSGVAALMLEKDPTLTQAQVEAKLKATATPLPTIIPPNPFAYGYVRWAGEPAPIYAFLWAADATGAGIIQADAAIAAIP
ncbi:MAG: S8 family serine peptidase [Candidatus Bathyarchaeota archaeon]|nr:S8 family serine peptidase [Candidatus Bathyarchaeota archaeon]